MGPSFWTRNKKAIHRMAPSSNLPRRKNSKIIHQRARSRSLSSGTVKEWFLWLWCQEERQLTPTLMVGCWQTWGSIQMGLALHKSNRNFVSSWQYRAAQEFEDGSHHKMCLNIVTPSTLQSQSSILRFPCIWSREGCNPWCEVWDYYQCDCVVKTWLHDWDKAWYQQGVHTFVLYRCKTAEVDGDFVKKEGMESNHHS